MSYRKKKKIEDSLITVQDLISSLEKNQVDMALKICESFLKNKTRMFFGCGDPSGAEGDPEGILLTSTKSFYIQFSRDILYDKDSKRSGRFRNAVSVKNSPYLPIILYSIYLMSINDSDRFNKKYISYFINEEKIKKINSVKSKILILDTFTKICEFSETLKSWKIPSYDMTKDWHEIVQSCKKSACERLELISPACFDIIASKIERDTALTQIQIRNRLSGNILNATTLQELNKVINHYGLFMYDLSILSRLKKISEISEAVILISENYQIDFTMDNFFDPSYQYYVFNCSQRTNKEFYNHISPYIKSKLDIIEALEEDDHKRTLKSEDSRASKFPMYTDININITI